MDTELNFSKIATGFNEYILDLQNKICKALEEVDGKARFVEDTWVREEGGGGKTRVIAGGNIFEKGGVSTSMVYGELPYAMQQAFKVGINNFFAAGLSLVLHPGNPYIPTVHANWRYFELFDMEGKIIDSWFGGGSDLTPYYLFEEDAVHFHTTYKNAIDPFGTDLYPAYKKNCDEYFVNKHRNDEARGIGGVFYDYLRPKNVKDALHKAIHHKPLKYLHRLFQKYFHRRSPVFFHRHLLLLPMYLLQTWPCRQLLPKLCIFYFEDPKCIH